VKLLDESWNREFGNSADQAQSHQEDFNDFKLMLSYDDLCTAIGCNEVKRMLEVINFDYSKIILRRCQPAGLCIKFHLDVSQQVMQVALNGDDEYVGGRLVYATASGELLVPYRPAGSYTVHNQAVVHGVSKHVSGMRYSLFFIKSSRDQ
jgi:hypothetical protein